MDLDDLVPQGAGSLRAPVTGPHGQTVASFTMPRDLALDEIWHGRRTTDATRDGSQGAPFGRPGYGLEHEPVNKAEREAQATARDAGDFETHVQYVRAALRPGGLA